MNLIPYGPHALLIRFSERADETAFQRCQVLMHQLEAQRMPEIRELVPAFTTLLLDCQPGTTRLVQGKLNQLIETTQPLPAGPESDRLIEIPTHYAGPDLDRVVQHSGISVEAVVERHLAPTYRVHCLGFAPGFPYLGGLDPILQTPRLSTPRPRVPAGSVAIGGEHTGVYSIASPGGWNLIGQTKVALFRPRAATLEEIFLLRSGDRVRFVRCGEWPEVWGNEADEISPTPSESFLRVLSAGTGLSIQDLGRPGFARFGVPPGGVMDPFAAAWANRLLDNPPGAPVLELCLQGQRLEVLQDGWLALTGSAQGASSPMSGWSAFRVHQGDLLEFPAGDSGVWSYLAAPGGFVGECFLGSASGNPRTGPGKLLSAGKELAVANLTTFHPPPATAGRRVFWTEIPEYHSPATLRVWPGPQWESFSVADRERFFSELWTISSQCDRVGYRLVGSALGSEKGKLISEPVLPGTIQVPANGQPIVTMQDGPTIGGFAKLGLVDPEDLPWLAQIRPGMKVSFVLAG